jgi:Type II CAAX prenyl endopeptidase Rce1-like
VWVGFFQTRLEARFNFIVAAVLTALPFAGVHVPLLLLDYQVSALSVLIGIGGLLILGIVVRLLMGVMLRAAFDSVLAVGILHQIFDASNNNSVLVDSLLDGADAGNMTQLAAVVLTVLVAAWLRVIVNGLAAILFMIGYALFGVAMIRTATPPRWSGVLVAVGAPAHLVGFRDSSAALDRRVAGRDLGSVSLVAGLAWPGYRLWHTPAAPDVPSDRRLFGVLGGGGHGRVVRCEVGRGSS